MNRKIFSVLKHTAQFFLKPIRPLTELVTYKIRSGPARGFKKQGGFLFIPAPLTDAEIMLERLNLKNKVVYDIGANIGIMSLAYSKYASRVYAFEPNSHSVSIIKKTLKMNLIKNVEVFNYAIGEKQSVEKLVVHNKKRGSGSLNKNFIEDFEKNGFNEYFEVKVVDLDSFIKKQNISPPGFIKIDTEGYEMNVLKGMVNTIEKYHPDFDIEMHKVPDYDGKSNSQNIVEFLIERNYKIYHSFLKQIITRDNHQLAKTGHLYCTVESINKFTEIPV